MSEELDNYEIEEHREPFIVDSDDKAAWAMRKLAYIFRKAKENEEIVNKEKTRLTHWIVEVNSPLAKNAAYFEDLLVDYMRREREANDRKSIKLPHGVVKSITTQEKIVPLGGFTKWAQENNRVDLLTFSLPKPNMAAIKQAVSSNEIDYDFIDIVPAEVSYSVKVSE